MSRAPWVSALLLLLPVVVYWPTVFHEYGFRDDYAHLREVRERPGWITELTTANGRPIYGTVLEASVRAIEQVTDLASLRLAGVLLVALTGILLWLVLRRHGWPETEAAVYGALVTLLPGAQVIAGWAITWPVALGLAVAVAGFAAVAAGLERRGILRVLGIAAGAICYILAAFTYQTSAMFVVAPLAALVLLRRQLSVADDARFVIQHIGVLVVSLLVTWLVMNLVFVEGLVREAARMRLEPEPLTKLLWFVRQPLPNSLALFALRDRFTEPVSFWIGFATVAAVIACGLACHRKERTQRTRWLVCLLVLPPVAHAVSLAASSQAIGYRTLLPMSGIFLALAVVSVRSILARYDATRRTRALVYGATVVVAAALAGRHAYDLVAVPQAREWGLMKAAVAGLALASVTEVYIIRPSIEERSTERTYADEFGTLTADADWAAKEMFKAAIRQRYPDGLPAGTSYSLTTSFYVPAWSAEYDLVLDMRELRTLGDRAVAKPAS